MNWESFFGWITSLQVLSSIVGGFIVLPTGVIFTVLFKRIKEFLQRRHPDRKFFGFNTKNPCKIFIVAPTVRGKGDVVSVDSSAALSRVNSLLSYTYRKRSKITYCFEKNLSVSDNEHANVVFIGKIESCKPEEQDYTLGNEMLAKVEIEIGNTNKLEVESKVYAVTAESRRRYGLILSMDNPHSSTYKWMLVSPVGDSKLYRIAEFLSADASRKMRKKILKKWKGRLKKNQCKYCYAVVSYIKDEHGKLELEVAGRIDYEMDQK